MKNSKIEEKKAVQATIKSAIDRALIQTPKNGIVLITGSLFVVAEAREYLLAINSE